MTERPRISDATAEAVLRGDAVDLPGLTAFAAEVRGARAEMAVTPPPVPTAELAQLLAGLAPLPAAAPSRWLPRVAAVAAAQVAGLGLGAKLAAAATVAAVGVTGAAAGDVLPAPAQRVLSDVVGAVTPFEVPDGRDTAPGRLLRPAQPSDRGDRDSAVAGRPDEVPAARPAQPATPAVPASPSGSGRAAPAQPASPATPAQPGQGRGPVTPPAGERGAAGDKARPEGVPARPSPHVSPTRTPDAAAGDDISSDRDSGDGAGADARSTTR